MSASPVWKCEKCGKAIEDNGGVVAVSYDDIAAHERGVEAFDQVHKERVQERVRAAGLAVKQFDYEVYDSNEFNDYPPAAHWHVLHDNCGAADIRNPYEIETGRISTWHAVAHWTSHLFGKRWFQSTDWDRLLERAGGLGLE